MMDIRNPVYLADGRIDCEVDLPNFGWQPYTASANDPDATGREIYAAAVEMDPAPYVAPIIDPVAELAAERALMRVSRYQALATLYTAGLLDAVNAFMGTQPFLTQLAWNETTEFARDNTTLGNIAAALGISDTQLDDLFRAGMAVTL